jgi:predicted permease
MIILASYLSSILAVVFALVTGYLYRKEDERYRYTAVASAVFGIIGAIGITGFLSMF